MSHLPSASVSDVGEVEDLATLAKLDEKVLLRQLKSRYERDKIYTYVGDILVSVNPFRDLGIYGKDATERYKMATISSQPPHIFAVADRSYQNIIGTRGNVHRSQCILISGESGAGKTESTKLLIKHLIELCRGNNQLEQQILQVNPLLEAFGNAQTTMNDNSSRFGKYIQLKFHNGRVLGAKISEYLLEKCRMVRQNDGERNFHIFYYMAAGLSDGQRRRYRLQPPDHYRYLSNGALHWQDHVTVLKRQYDELLNAMDMVGFTDKEQEDMFTILVATLTFGNIDIVQSEHGDATVSKNGAAISAVVEFLGLRNVSEMHTCLTQHVSYARGELICKNYTPAQAIDSRDAIAKTLYGRLFSWIVNKINSLLVEREVYSPEMVQEIGILDIFGFEHFRVNSFEQACINLANEQLQFFFNKHIFSLEQEEYKGEGIDWTEIKFVDNQPLLNIFLGRPIGILTLLDEESLFPNGSDESFVQKMDEHFKKDEHYIKSPQAGSAKFTIAHYAGKVTYTSTGWLEKNRDTLPPGVMQMLQSSSNWLLSLIFKGKISRTGTLALNQKRTVRTTRHKARQAAKDTKERKLTVGHQFKNSLNVLMERMTNSRPVFIRCLKPNSRKLARSFEDEYVTAQLLYTGMLETTKIRREGFAVRPCFAEFVERYKILVHRHDLPANAQNCRYILQTAGIQGWRMGKTKVFLKYWHIDQLAELLEWMVKNVVHMQRVIRGFLGRRRCRKLRLEAARQAQLIADLCHLVSKCNTTSISNQFLLKDADTKIPDEYFTVNRNNQVAPSILSVETGYLQPQETEAVANSNQNDEGDTESDGEVAEDVFVAAQSPADRFGPAGSRSATMMWFMDTQREPLRKANGGFIDWFHGIITRSQAEKLLKNKPIGCFLIRVSESRFGYSLSFLTEKRCRHYMISLLSNGKFIVVGENRAHPSLNALVEYLQKNPLSNWNGLLTVPCGQEDGQCDYAELLDDQVYLDLESERARDRLSSITVAPPTLPHRNYSLPRPSLHRPPPPSLKTKNEVIVDHRTRR